MRRGCWNASAAAVLHTTLSLDCPSQRNVIPLIFEIRRQPCPANSPRTLNAICCLYKVTLLAPTNNRATDYRRPHSPPTERSITDEMPEFVSTPLFGGAIVCDLPEHFADVRYVWRKPNHQSWAVAWPWNAFGLIRETKQADIPIASCGRYRTTRRFGSTERASRASSSTSPSASASPALTPRSTAAR